LGIDCGRLNELLASLSREFGFIVVDLPQAESSVCFAAAGLLNGVLLVMEAERTHHAAASRAKARLLHANAAVLGVIFNKHRQHLPNWLSSRL
jgi:Mrp family chromosome partitioning ATPase